MEAYPATRYPYRRGEPVPHGYRVVEHPIRGLVIAGAITFGVSYLSSVALAPSKPSLNWLAVPVAGPYLAASQVRECPDFDYASGMSTDDSDCVYDSEASQAYLRFDGFLQVTGVALFAVGMAVKSRHLVREAPPVALQVVPYRVGRDGAALGLIGRF